MAKLGNSTGRKTTDLTNIIVDDNNNSRKSYDKNKIEERARSIEELTLLEPVIVQEKENEPGRFILVSGFCRYKAHQLLVSEGKPYNQIFYVVVAGDPFMINLAENIQRSDLNSMEIETALKIMTGKGDTPKQISTKLKKPLSWVCDRLKAEEIRSVIKENTDDISSSALSHLRNLPEETVNKIIPEIKAEGGTVKAAKKAVDNLKNKDQYIKKPENKDPFSGLFSQLRMLVRLSFTHKEIINAAVKYLEGLK